MHALQLQGRKQEKQAEGIGNGQSLSEGQESGLVIREECQELPETGSLPSHTCA